MRGSPGTGDGELEADKAHLDFAAFSQWSDLAVLCARAESFPVCVLTVPFCLALEPVSGLNPHCGISNQYQPLCLFWLTCVSPVTPMSKPSAPVPNKVTIFREEAFKEVIKAK